MKVKATNCNLRHFISCKTAHDNASYTAQQAQRMYNAQSQNNRIIHQHCLQQTRSDCEAQNYISSVMAIDPNTAAKNNKKSNEALVVSKVEGALQ